MLHAARHVKSAIMDKEKHLDTAFERAPVSALLVYNTSHCLFSIVVIHRLAVVLLCLPSELGHCSLGARKGI